MSHLLDKEQDDKNENLLSINNLINLVNLNDDEKIKFLKLPEQKKNDYLINKFKFMLILLTQEKKVDQNFYLN